MMPPKWGDNAFKQCRVAPGVSCVFTKANRKSFWPTRVLLILDCFQIQFSLAIKILIGRRRVCAVLLVEGVPRRPQVRSESGSRRTARRSHGARMRRRSI